MLGIGTFAVHSLNYAYHIIAARRLNAIDYGELSTLLALFMILSVASQVLQTTVTRHWTDISATHPLRARGIITHKSLIFSWYFLLIGAALIPFLCYFLGLSSGSLIITFIAGGAAILLGSLRGILQGSNNIQSLSANLSLESFIKVITLIAFLYFGLTVNAGVGAILLSIVLSIFTLSPKFQHTKHAQLPENFTHAAHSCLGFILLFTLMYNGDQLLVRAFLPDNSADFGVISRLSQLTLFGSVMLTTIWFSRMNSSNTQANAEQNKTETHLTFMLIIVGIIASMTLWYFFGTPIITLIFGENYAHIAPLLPLHALNMGLLGIIYFLCHGFLLKNSRAFLAPFTFGLLLFIILITLFHASLSMILWMIFLSLAVTLILLSVVYKRQNAQ